MNNNIKESFNKDILIIKDIESECNRIVTHLRESVLHRLNRVGVVIGISGGIDSSVSMALAVKALGTEKVLAIMLPEHDSSGDSALFAQKLADKFGVEAITENITGALEGFGCYKRRDEAVRKIFPEYDPFIYKMKIGISSSGLYTNLPPLFSLTIIDGKGNIKSKRVPAPELRQIEAASNFKQRSRMSMLYYHAERLHYAVIGTPNKHEVEQGFFVKNGDGGAFNYFIRNAQMSGQLVNLCFIQAGDWHHIGPAITVFNKETLLHFMFIGCSDHCIMQSFGMIIQHRHTATLFKVRGSFDLPEFCAGSLLLCSFPSLSIMTTENRGGRFVNNPETFYHRFSFCNVPDHIPEKLF